MSSLEDSDNDDSLGLIPEREEPGKTGAPCDKVPGPSPAKVVLDGLVIWSCTSHPGILGSISKREEPVRDGQTSPHKPRLVVSLSTCPPLSPFQRELLYDRYCSNKQQPPQRGKSPAGLGWATEIRKTIAYCVRQLGVHPRPTPTDAQA